MSPAALLYAAFTLLPSAISAATPGAADALKLEPVQPEVDFQRVPPSEAKLCKVVRY